MGGDEEVLLVRAAGGFHRDAGQSSGPVEQIGAFRSLLDKLWCSLNKREKHRQSPSREKF